MVDFLNDDITFEGEVTTESELFARGGLVIGEGGQYSGETAGGANSWRAHTRIHVANVAERDAVEAWRAANDPISASNPLLVWRANGSLTGVNEITVDGINWYAETPLSGDVEMTLATSAPYGWALLQGQVLANAAVDYAALWAAASPVFRSGGSLVLPDLRGRVPMGAGEGTGLTLRNLGDQTGAESVAITTAQLAAHTHTGDTDDNDVDAYFTYDDAGSNPAGEAPIDRGSSSSDVKRTIRGSAHSHLFTTNATGGGEGHPNVQPSLALNFKVKL